jgi:hypothetical protein
MAKCDEGYRCEVCGQDVEHVTDSDLYLRYVIGELDPELLHVSPERHIRCNPVLAQFIVDVDFPPVNVEVSLDKRYLDAAYVAAREALVTRGWKRLRELGRDVESVLEYPLPDVMARMQRQFGVSD